MNGADLPVFFIRSQWGLSCILPIFLKQKKAILIRTGHF